MDAVARARFAPVLREIARAPPPSWRARAAACALALALALACALALYAARPENNAADVAPLTNVYPTAPCTRANLSSGAARATVRALTAHLHAPLAPRALAAAHVGARDCVLVVRRGVFAAKGGGGVLALANPRVVARSAEMRVSEERDSLCRVDAPQRFVRARRITVAADGGTSAFEDDEAAAVAHAIDVLEALRVCSDHG
jgi:hypothetical protein